MYKAKCDKDEAVFKCGKVGNTLGYELINTYFVDNSGFGSDSEPALTVSSFLDKVKQGMHYVITSIGQFQIYIGEYKKVARKADFARLNILSSKKLNKNLRLTEYNNGDKSLVLYSTEIVKQQGNKIILNSGGYRTHTTKTRINEFLPKGCYVYQKNYTWYIHLQSKGVIEFFDGIELTI